MKQLIPLILSLAITGLFLYGCESISDSDPAPDALLSTGEISGVGTLSGGITKEMCMEDPGWEALGFRNLGQCVRYVETGKDSRPPDNGNTVSDIDGNVYQIVTIGSQVWMAENLRTTTYSDGTPIPTGLTDTDWSNTTNGAYAIYPHSQIDGLNSDTEVAASYGNLYNWYAVADEGGLCPTGWHVPNEGEWITLVDYLGGILVAGGKMKSTRTVPELHPRWNSPNTDATDEGGWSGLPGGYRYLSGSYNLLGGLGYWWNSTVYGSDNGGIRILAYNSATAFKGSYDKSYGFSVRCVRD